MFDEPATTSQAIAGPRPDLTALMYGGNSGQTSTPGLFATDALVGGASSSNKVAGGLFDDDDDLESVAKSQPQKAQANPRATQPKKGGLLDDLDDSDADDF